MTIQKGQPWGVPIRVPIETRDVASDVDLSHGSQTDFHIVTGGDLFHALGRPRVPVVGEERTLVRIDALRCTVATPSHDVVVLAASHVSIGQWWTVPWRIQRFVCITNPGIYKGRNIAPRAHPNDGFLDILAIDDAMPWRQRIASRQRATTGNHVPHPHISVTRDTSVEVACQSSHETLKIDDVTIDNWQRIAVEVLPDYWQVIV